MNVSKKINLMVKIALLSAIALVLMFLEFPIFPEFSFLKLDASDLPVLIGSFAFGPIAGIVIEAIKNILIIFIKGTITGGVGELANFIIGASFVGTAGLIYKIGKSKKTAIMGLIAGTLAMIIIGVLANYFIILPLYSKFLPVSNTKWVVHYLIAGVVPFNAIKAGVISVVTLLIYKRVSILIRAEVNRHGQDAAKKSA